MAEIILMICAILMLVIIECDGATKVGGSTLCSGPQGAVPRGFHR